MEQFITKLDLFCLSCSNLDLSLISLSPHSINWCDLRNLPLLILINYSIPAKISNFVFLIYLSVRVKRSFYQYLHLRLFWLSLLLILIFLYSVLQSIFKDIHSSLHTSVYHFAICLKLIKEKRNFYLTLYFAS